MAGIWHRWQYNSCIVFAVVVDVVKYIYRIYIYIGGHKPESNMQYATIWNASSKLQMYIEKNVMQENKTLYL